MENSLAEINLESMGGGVGGDKRFNIFLGSKIGKHLQLYGQVHNHATGKSLEGRTRLDEPIECAS